MLIKNNTFKNYDTLYAMILNVYDFKPLNPYIPIGNYK